MSDKDIVISNIDAGNSFNWGKTSKDYAKYRDIYPEEFYQYIINLGLCKDGQKCLDIGTGTGVLPRNMYKYGADWTGTDISENQIKSIKGVSKFLKHMISTYVYCNKNIVGNELEGESILLYLLDVFSKAVISVNIGEKGDAIPFDSKDRKKYFKEQKIFNLISDHLRKKCIQSINNDPDNEYYYRLKLVTDYVSGMTDNYAKNLYCHLKGIK